MNIVTLKDGTVIAEPMALVLNMSLNTLMSNNPIALYELVMLCCDAKHQLFGNTGTILRDMALIEPDGSIRDEIKAFFKNSAQGDGPDMQFVNPIKQDTSGPEKSKVRESADFELYKIIRLDIPLVFKKTISEIGKGKFTPIKKGEIDFNPYYNQVNGLFIAEHYGTPSELWTPWGETSCAFFGETKDKELNKLLYSKFDAKLIIPKTTTTAGVHGPVYALHTLHGKPLPVPQMLERSAYLSYDEVETLTKAFKTEYRRLFKRQKN